MQKTENVLEDLMVLYKYVVSYINDTPANDIKPLNQISKECKIFKGDSLIGVVSRNIGSLEGKQIVSVVRID